MQSTKTTIILTTAILLLTILGAGCTDTGGANPQTPKYTTPPEEVPVVEETATAVEDTPEPVETPWYEIKEGFENVEVGTYSTMFGLNIDSVKYPSVNGGYSLYNKNEFLILLLDHSEFDASYPLHNKLPPDQYRTLVDEYGDMRHITREAIDLNQDGTMDKVAVKYVGVDGEFTVVLFACTVDTLNDNSNETGLFDMAFKLLPTRISCDDVENIRSPTLLNLYVIEPNDEWVLSNFERLY